MLRFICVLCVIGTLQTLGISGNQIVEANEDGGVMEYLLAKIENLERQHKNEMGNMKHQIEEMKNVNERQQKRIEHLEKLLNTETSGELGHADTDRLPSQQKRNQDSMRNSGIRQAQTEMPVSFFATLYKHMSDAGANQNIPFEHVVTNNGNAYNPHTGVFTAPVTGTYVFSATVTVNATSSTHVGFSHNGNKVTTMNINGSIKHYDSSSDTIVLNLNQGDDVTVKNFDIDKHLYGSSHSMFSGFLLYI